MAAGSQLGKKAFSVKRIEIRAIQHATESKEKVLSAIETLVPRDVAKLASLLETRVRGHYGNPIVVYALALEGEAAEAALRHIVCNLNEASRRLLSATLDERVHKGVDLHIRLHKQLLAQGQLAIWEGDETVKVLVRFFGKKDLHAFREELSSGWSACGSTC